MTAPSKTASPGGQRRIVNFAGRTGIQTQTGNEVKHEYEKL